MAVVYMVEKWVCDGCGATHDVGLEVTAGPSTTKVPSAPGWQTYPNIGGRSDFVSCAKPECGERVRVMSKVSAIRADKKE